MAKHRQIKKNKPIKLRNKAITSAWLRSGAGVMKDRRAPKGGTRRWKDHLREEG